MGWGGQGRRPEENHWKKIPDIGTGECYMYEPSNNLECSQAAWNQN